MVIKKLTKYKLYELVKTMVRKSSFFIFHYCLFKSSDLYLQ